MVIFGLAPNGSAADDVGMAYIVTRNHRFYVVAYDGIDPVTGKERRRWHPAGRSRADAEAVAASITEAVGAPVALGRDAIALSEHLAVNWLPKRARRVRPTTAYRYGWMIEHYINPAIGDYALRSIRTEHIDALYGDLLTSGGRSGDGLAPKTVHEVHVIIRSALDDAIDAGLLRANPATKARPPRSQARPRAGQTTWNADQLADFLTVTSHRRLYPALHLAASTGMRRGEIAGLRWSDWNQRDHRLSINRSRQVVAGRSAEFAPKTRTSRRCIDLDPTTEAHLDAWRQRQLDDSPSRHRRPHLHQHRRPPAPRRVH